MKSKCPAAVGIAFPAVPHGAGVGDTGRTRLALLGWDVPAHPPCGMILSQTSDGASPSPGDPACPALEGATPSLALLPSALGQVAWDESDS